jgi:hypothetical protein
MPDKYILLALLGFEELNTVWNITIENLMKVALEINCKMISELRRAL